LRDLPAIYRQGTLLAGNGWSSAAAARVHGWQLTLTQLARL